MSKNFIRHWFTKCDKEIYLEQRIYKNATTFIDNWQAENCNNIFMTTDNIVEVGIDNKERIYIKPETKHFEFIWRDASEISWDDKEKVLYSPKPKEWTYFDWYRQILLATKGEYGCQLVLTNKTQWKNIPDELKKQIIEL